jgi:hypothetical protein
MKIITLLTILFVGWIIYALIQSNMSIQKELREMRNQCMNSNNGNYNSISNASPSNSSPSSYSNNYGNYSKDSLNLIKNTLISSLTNILPNNQ